MKLSFKRFMRNTRIFFFRAEYPVFYIFDDQSVKQINDDFMEGHPVWFFGNEFRIELRFGNVCF